VNIIIRQAYQQAEDILTKNKSLLEKIVTELISKETLEREQFLEIVGGHNPDKKKTIASSS